MTATTGRATRQAAPTPIRRPIALAAQAEPANTSDWRARAACRGVDPEVFYPVGNNVHALAAKQQARATCAGCPVQEACLSWAIDTDEPSGVWGGLTRRQRLELVKTGRARKTVADPGTLVVPPRVQKVLDREVQLRKLRRDGVTLRRCAPVMGETYENVRRAWKVLERRDAEAAVELGAAA